MRYDPQSPIESAGKYLLLKDISRLIIMKKFLVIVEGCSENDVANFEEELLAVREGTVKNETFVYLYVFHQGNINLSLKSVAGDADLYISETNRLPTYDVDLYDLHSATCGIDVIRIPKKLV